MSDVSLSYDEARDVMFAIFLAAWAPRKATYTDTPAVADDFTDAWARVSIRHAFGAQTSLADATSKTRYASIGTLIIQVFAPIGDGTKTGYEEAQLLVNAYRQANHPNLWFRNVRINEVGQSGAFTQINVLADFNYDTLL